MFLNKFEVAKITGQSLSTIRRNVKRGTFPPPRQISKRKIAWIASEIQTWIDSLPVATAEQPDELKFENKAPLFKFKLTEKSRGCHE